MSRLMAAVDSYAPTRSTAPACLSKIQLPEKKSWPFAAWASRVKSRPWLTEKIQMFMKLCGSIPPEGYNSNEHSQIARDRGNADRTQPRDSGKCWQCR